MNNWKIGNKLLVFILSSSLILISILIAFNVKSSTKVALQLLDGKCQETAYRYANQVKIKFEESMAIARNLAFQIEGLKKEGLNNREEVLQMLKMITKKNDFILGAWIVFEDDKFDGKNSEYKNVKGFDYQGRFLPYWYKIKGQLHLKNLTYPTEDPENDWYMESRRSGKEALTEPYTDILGGEKILMSTFSVPIKVNGEILGVIGIDLALTAFQNMVEDIRPEKTGFAFIFSNKGMFVAHPVFNNNDIVGKTFLEIVDNEETRRILKKIENGKEFLVDGIDFSTGNPIKIAYAPVSISNTGKPWSVGIAMPLTILNKLNTTKWYSIFVGFVILIIMGLITTYIVFKIIVHPLKKLTNYANQIATGDLDLTIDIDKNDEIGILADSFKEVQRTSENLAKIINSVHGNYSRGNLEAEFEINCLKGEWKKLMERILISFDIVISPVREGIRILSKVKDGDLREKMEVELEGDFNLLKTAVNDVHAWLISLIDFSKKIASGNIKDAHIEKASENDQVYGWLILMKDDIQKIMEEVNNFADLATKGDVENIKLDRTGVEGAYSEILDKLEKTVQAIKEPLAEVNEVMKKMSNKDLTATIKGNYEGIYDELKKSINDFSISINNSLSQVHLSAKELNIGSSQISDASQSLSSNSTEQAASVEELNASMTVLSSKTKNNTENAEKASKLAREAEKNSQKGVEEADRTIKAMELISNSSEEIKKIIKVIDDIAFQTNLLALNAAVEAARAGVHGKGFGVVADEVRNLAQRSAEAAKETTELIEESAKNVAIGNETVKETVNSLNEILAGSIKTADLVEEISVSNEEQHTGIEQSSQGLGHISGATQHNASVAEEIASVSVELNSQAENLKRMVEAFTLNEDLSNKSRQKISPKNRLNSKGRMPLDSIEN